MDTALAGGDFSLGANGLPRGISGEEELLQRAAIRLRVPLGRFALQPALGSRLYTLRSETEDKDANALAMAQEALRELPQVWVESAVCSAAEPLIARIQITWKGGGAEIEVTCDGDI